MRSRSTAQASTYEEVISIATSTRPQPADFSKCELKDGVPAGSEYSGKPKLAPQPKRLPLPAGKTKDGLPEEKLN
jgi:hypothetical protein